MRGVEMRHFTIRVWSSSDLAVEKRIVSKDPVAELELMPGRYRWSVQWWSTTREPSEVAESQVSVAHGSDAWEGVPWRGASDKNEFTAEAVFDKGDAELLVATLGFGYVTVNGREVSNDLLSYSGWTRTEKRVLYRSYDISSMLNSSLGATFFVRLGCGYRCDTKGRWPQYRDPGDSSTDTIAKIFRLQVRVRGSLAFHSGSPGWMARSGATVQDSVYDGEVYVATSVGDWTPSVDLPPTWGPKGAMVPASFPGVQIVGKDAAVSIKQAAPGVHVVDFGSNVAGVCSISVPGAATVSLKHGEVMQHEHLPDLEKADPSRVYFGNLRTAEANDTLVTDQAIADWTPRFTYHGFRYVEVYGYPGTLEVGSIQRLRLSTAVPDKATALFSDEVLAAIAGGSRGSQRSNLMQVLTDCPQRDERLGWLGDASLSIESMLLHFDMGTMAADFVDSMVDELDDAGSLPDVVPWQRFGGRPADLSWSSAFVGSLHALWKDGDVRPAAKHWPAVLRHIGNLQAQYAEAGALRSLPEAYGDWCPPPKTPGGGDKEHASHGFAAAFSLVRVLQQAAELGAAIGGPAAGDARNISAFARRLGEEFHASYYNASLKLYDNGAMITFVLPLALGIVPEDDKQSVFQNLLQKVETSNGTWTGGIINNRFLFDVLHDNGAASLALAMLTRKAYPSYGYMYFNEYEPGKEGMWELPDAPFQGPSMNSRNHHMYSSVGHYLLTRMAGLKQVGVGEFSATVGLLDYAASRLKTPRGEVAFGWRRSSGVLLVNVTAPVGTRVHVHFPDVGDVHLDGRPVRKGSGVHRVLAKVWMHSGTFTRVTVGSGGYSFSVGSEALFA